MAGKRGQAPEKHRSLIALCGRTNVGKSTLFNRLTEKNQALVSDIAGTTRDSNLGLVEWAGTSFSLADTAGLIDAAALNVKKIKGEDIDSQAQKQAKSYLDEADLIIFLVDTKTGLLPEDKALAAGLKKNEKYRRKTIVVANKVDSFRLAGEAAQFNKLGLGEPLIVSAATGMGSGDLLDIIVAKLGALGKALDIEATEMNKGKFKTKKGATGGQGADGEIDDVNEKEVDAEKNADGKIEVNGEEMIDSVNKSFSPKVPETITACIIGKPNVGKSSLLNSLLGYERVIVSPLPHTTREPQNTEVIYQNKKIILVDTAGISKQGTKTKGLEKPGILKSLSSLDKADIALLVLDVSEILTHQDAKIIQEIVERRKSLIIIANKWDQISPRDPKKYSEIIYDKLPFATWAPIQFISAKTGEKVDKILDLILEVATGRQLTLSDSQTEKFLKHVVKIHKPAKGKGLKAPHIYEFRQAASNPPAFTLRIGPNDDLHFSYVRFVENRLRERHGFLGTPLNVRVTKDKKSHTTYNDRGDRKRMGAGKEDGGK